jgi:hypothetical protein
MALLATVAFSADKKTYRYNCKGGAFTITAAVEASGRWVKAEPVVLQIDTEPPQTLIADPDVPDADSFKNKDYEFYALKAFITPEPRRHREDLQRLPGRVTVIPAAFHRSRQPQRENPSASEARLSSGEPFLHSSGAPLA